MGVTVFLLFLCLLPCLHMDVSMAYNKFIVGESYGWTNPQLLHPYLDYNKWASTKSFYLGDTLIFNYPDKNHTVIVTHNKALYTSCDVKHHKAMDYDIFGEAGVTKQSEVHLVETGATYIICGAYNGEHCKAGMRFIAYVKFSANSNSPPSSSHTPPAPFYSSPTPPSSSETPPTPFYEPPPYYTTEPPPLYGWSPINLAPTLHPYPLQMLLTCISFFYCLLCHLGL